MFFVGQIRGYICDAGGPRATVGNTIFTEPRGVTGLYKLCFSEGYTWSIKIYAEQAANEMTEVRHTQNMCKEFKKNLL
jgi:hypothetical protein